ncbi:MAG: hypothetical protein GX601_09590 [Anaerolineales bacterium]|nr:hypothetical protein [Anaerolineales bacterium]
MGSSVPDTTFQHVHASFCARGGRLLLKDGELYRGLSHEVTPLYERLFSEGTIDDLMQDGALVHTERTDESVEEFGLVVKHRLIPYVSYPYEWCSAALRYAALFFLDFNLRLLGKGLLCFDATPYNIVFEGTEPVYVDFESIRPWDSVNLTVWLADFQALFLRPLEMYQAGHERYVRLGMAEWRGWQRGVSPEDYVRLMDRHMARRMVSSAVSSVVSVASRLVPARLRGPARRVWGTIRSARSEPAPPRVPSRDELAKLLSDLRKKVEPLCPLPVLGWDYYRDLFAFPSLDDKTGWSAKQLAVSDAFERAAPRSVLDVGSNRGWYSQLAARRGARVIAWDRDDRLVSLLFNDAHKGKLDIQPLVMDLVWPTPAQGLGGVWQAAEERHRCDMVLCLALIHHLVHIEGMHFDRIVLGLSDLTDRWLLIEFVPYADPNLAQWPNLERRDWYTLEGLLTALEPQFSVLYTAVSDPRERTLIFAEKKHAS